MRSRFISTRKHGKDYWTGERAEGVLILPDGSEVWATKRSAKLYGKIRRIRKTGCRIATPQKSLILDQNSCVNSAKMGIVGRNSGI